jgi:alkylated DNA repair protein (DNA oxidative demethylase)
MKRTKIIRTDVAPEGLVYVDEFLSAAQEADILDRIIDLEYGDFILNGVTARRKVLRFGYSYEFYAPLVSKIEPFPDWLERVKNAAARYAGMAPQQIEQALIARYEPGAGIGWHRDAPAYGPTVIGVSLATDDVMRFRRKLDDSTYEIYKQPVERRSLYVIGGAARSQWQHSLTPAESLRFSITFRTVNEKYKEAVAVS